MSRTVDADENSRTAQNIVIVLNVRIFKLFSFNLVSLCYYEEFHIIF